MKFDVVIGNPPYCKGLHIKFLELALILSREVVFVEPAFFITSFKAETPRIAVLRRKLAKYIESVDLINGNKYFHDASFFSLLGIFKMNKNKSNKDIKVFNEDLNTLGDYEIDDICYANKLNPALSKEIKNKVLNQSKATLDNYVRNDGEKTSGYVSNFSRIRGNISDEGKPNWTFYTFMSNLDLVPSRSRRRQMHFVEFSNELECKNFIDSLNTDFMMFMLSMTKTNVNVKKSELKNIPYMKDYTKPWTDERFAEHYGLSNKEVEYIKEEMRLFGWKTQK